jgi:hypothetical protein
MPSYTPKALTFYKSLFKRFYITFLLCIVVCFSITLPLFTSHFPLPAHASSSQKLHFVTLWLFACTPPAFFLGCIVGGVYYYPSWRASILDTKLAEEERERDKIRERLSAQLLRTGCSDEASGARLTTIDLRELQRPGKAASRFSGVRRGMKKLQQQFRRRDRETWQDELVLWDADDIELTDMTMEASGERGIERESGRNSEESSMRWEQVGFEDIDLGTVGRVRVKEMV